MKRSYSTLVSAETCRLRERMSTDDVARSEKRGGMCGIGCEYDADSEEEEEEEGA
jgi:hypothetical protein